LPAYLSNAQSAAARGLPAEQAVWLQAALMLEPGLVEASLQLIDAMLRRGAIGEAIALAANLVEREPQHARALGHLGYALQLAGRHAEAIPLYRRAYALDKAVPTLRNNLAVALEITGHDDEALALLEEAVAVNAGDIEAWTNLSRIYPRRLDLARAIAAGERAVQIDPSNALAQSNYSLALKEAQRWDAATGAATAAAEASPHAPRFPFNQSLLDLLQRNYTRGWAGFEARWEGRRNSRTRSRTCRCRAGTARRCAARRCCCGASRVSATRCSSAASYRCSRNRSMRKAASSCGRRSGRSIR